MHSSGQLLRHHELVRLLHGSAQCAVQARRASAPDAAARLLPSLSTLGQHRLATQGPQQQLQDDGVQITRTVEADPEVRHCEERERWRGCLQTIEKTHHADVQALQVRTQRY